MANDRPAFLITIDTEGDNLWSRPRKITTENSRFLPRFQELCQRYGFKPTWLTNYEMAKCPVFCEFASDALRREACEVGMHLHAWNSPPIVPLTDDDFTAQPYLIDYPEAVMRDKIDCLTDLLEETFACPMRSHRAGRWAIDSAYVRLLRQRGYLVDCSVTPGIDWGSLNPATAGHAEVDYRGFPTEPYQMDAEDISRAGELGMLQLPMTILPAQRGAMARLFRGTVSHLPGRTIRRLADYALPEVWWLRPNGRNCAAMIGLVRWCVEDGQSYVEFMLHSSELMPGGSTRFPNQRSIERLYEDLTALFEVAASLCRGATLSEFAQQFASSRQEVSGAAS